MSLPHGWELKTLGDVCYPPQYGWTTKAVDAGNLHLLRTSDITSGRIEWDKVPFCENEPTDIEKYLIKDGDIVISRAGSVGFSQLIKNPQPSVFASYLIRFRPLINEKYVAYFLQSLVYWQAISDNKIGIAIPNVNATKLKKIPIPVAPLAEQERISARIEELFTQLDAGVDSLQRVKEALKRYKASVLKAAVEGRLVPQDPNDEPAEELLRRIGKKPLERDDLPELPEGWCWVKVGDIANHRLGKMLDIEKNKGKNRPYLRNINVRWFEFDISDIQLMRVEDKEIDNVTAMKGDLIICEGGEPGRAAVWNSNENIVLQKALHRVRTNQSVLPSFLMYCLASDANSGSLSSYFTGSTIKHFTGQSLNIYKFPLPPIAEQYCIVGEVERRLSLANQIEKAVEVGLKREERLKQAILKQAFEGRLLS
jgi:type I restriction enzyme, S subunit